MPYVHTFNESLAQKFVRSAICIFLITGVAKIASAFGDSEILNRQDPVFSLQYRLFLLWVGSFELVLAMLVIYLRQTRSRLIAVSGVVISILAYRIAKWWVSAETPCACLGTIFDRLRIPPEAIDWISLALLAYLVVGLGLALAWGSVCNSDSCRNC